MNRGTLVRAIAAFALLAALCAPALADDQSSSTLSIGRVLAAPNHGDSVLFSNIGASATPIDGTLFGLRFSSPLGTGAGAPKLFEQYKVQANQFLPAATQSASQQQTFGVQFQLLGSQSSLSVQSAQAGFRAGGPAYGSVNPAVFSFYNFPGIASVATFGGAFALDGAPAVALAPDGAPDFDPAATSALSFPLINSLSAQGPFWYGDIPAMQGSAVQLSVPVNVAHVGLKIRFGEQSATAVQPNSLADQILGPAFTSSLSSYSSLGGGVTVALPLLNRRATVSLDGLYQSLQQNNPANADTLPVGQATTPALPANGPVVFSSGPLGAQQYVGAASLALPVSSRLTVKGSFSEQVGGSVDLDALTQSLTQHTTGFGGGLVYNIPKSNSSINFFFNRNVYSDDASPASNWTQSSQNLYFNVKF